VESLERLARLGIPVRLTGGGGGGIAYKGTFASVSLRRRKGALLRKG